MSVSVWRMNKAQEQEGRGKQRLSRHLLTEGPAAAGGLSLLPVVPRRGPCPRSASRTCREPGPQSQAEAAAGGWQETRLRRLPAGSPGLAHAPAHSRRPTSKARRSAGLHVLRSQDRATVVGEHQGGGSKDASAGGASGPRREAGQRGQAPRAGLPAREPQRQKPFRGTGLFLPHRLRRTRPSF